MDRRKTTIITVIIAGVIVAVGALIGSESLLGNFVLVAIIVIAIPYFLRRFAYYRWLTSIENQFPNFVKDIADSRRSGMSLPQSIRLAAKGNYGNLSAEVITMRNKLSLGIPFIRVLEMFGNKLHDSKVIRESLTIIIESYQAGGNISAILDTIARDIVMLKETEAERVSMVKQNVMIMYGIFFMFVGISIMIIFVMIPMVQTQPLVQSGAIGFSFSNPCEGVGYFPCSVFNFIGFFLGVEEGIANYYVSVFFTVVVILGIFTGLIAGQLGQNSLMAGSKHALIMTIAGIAIFIFVTRGGFLPV